MKTRLGFISNSSSSSFVMFVPEKEHIHALEEARQLYPEACEKLEEAFEKCETSMGTWYKSWSCETPGDCYSFIDDCGEEGENAYYYYQKRVPNECCLCHTEDM